MVITKQQVAEKIASYLHHEIDTEDLVAWAELALLNDDFMEDDIEVLSEVIGRLGVADVRAFGLVWEDCEALLGQLGYKARVEIVAG